MWGSYFLKQEGGGGIMHEHKQLFDHCVIPVFVCIKVQRWCLPSTMAWPPGVFTPPICSSNRRLRRTTRLISRQQIRASRTNSRSVKPTAGPLSHAHFSLWQLCQAGYVFNGAYLFTIIQLGQGFNDIFRKCWSCDTQSKTPQWQTKGRNDLKKNVNYSVEGKKRREKTLQVQQHESAHVWPLVELRLHGKYGDQRIWGALTLELPRIKTSGLWRSSDLLC